MALTAKQLAAGQHVADDRLSNEHIAQLAGVSRRTLTTWKKLPLFAERVAAIQERAAIVLETNRLKGRDTRIAQAQARHDAINAAVAARAAMKGMDDVPGWSTGWVIKHERVIGVGAAAKKIVEYEFALADMAHQLADEKRVAQEMHQWGDKATSLANATPQSNVIFYLPEKEPYPTLVPPQKKLDDVIEHEA